MTQREFSQLLEILPALSPEQLQALRRELDSQQLDSPTPAASDEALQRRLLEAGIISEIKPPIRDLMPYRNRQAVPINGEPLSETIIRERR
jgi:hypothetical protein